jgi:hypothetical protein
MFASICNSETTGCCLRKHLLALRGPNPVKFQWSCCLCNTRLWAALLKPLELMYKNCTYYVYILSSFLYAGFMLYKFYIQLLASFLSLKLSLLLSILLLDIRNSTAPGYCLCSCWLCKTLLQYSWLLSLLLVAIWNSAAIQLAMLSLQLLAIWNSAAILLAIVNAAVAMRNCDKILLPIHKMQLFRFMKLYRHTPGYYLYSWLV